MIPANQTENFNPEVSIGLPVFNGESTIRATIDSLLNQNFENIEIIISDNASTDKTEEICRGYAAIDNRIRYFRQSKNKGPGFNFEHVLQKAQGKYFMWTGCDDVFSSDFVLHNKEVLEQFPEFIASTSPNGFSNVPLEDQELNHVALDGNLYDRFITFFNHCWVAHGLFFSLIRIDALRNCELVGQSFYASDWAIILYLASQGKINRINSGHAIFGAYGISSRSEIYLAFQKNPLEKFFPLLPFTIYTCSILGSFTFKQRITMFKILLKLNLTATFVMLRTRFKN